MRDDLLKQLAALDAEAATLTKAAAKKRDYRSAAALLRERREIVLATYRIETEEQDSSAEAIRLLPPEMRLRKIARARQKIDGFEREAREEMNGPKGTRGTA